MILAIILAVSISSDSIKEFFNLPAGVPGNVSSFNTPGSDPSGGGGWYIDGKPRSPRLTPEVMAGVNSTFEGLFERMYYAGQGQSNVWDTAEWGPRLDKKAFWFDPGFGEIATGGWDYEGGRTNVSRRIIEYANIDSLANYIISMVQNGSGLFGAYDRPGWIRTSTPSDRQCWWSNSGPILSGEINLLPSFSWINNPLSSSTRWKDHALTIGCLDYNYGDIWCFYSLESPSIELMDGMGFGQDNWDADIAHPGLRSGVDFASFITNNFPHADPYAITNANRRLFSDRLCCMNQVLSLLDTTIMKSDVEYPHTMTNISYANRVWMSGECPITISRNGLTLTATIDGDGDPGLEIASNNLRSVSSSYASESPIMYRFSGTSTIATGGAGPSIELTSQLMELDDVVVSDILSQSGCPFTGSIMLSMVPSIRNNDVVVDIEVQDESNTTYTATVSCRRILDNIPTNGLMKASLYYERSYYHAKSIGPAMLAVTQPGWQSGDRAATNDYGIITGIHYSNTATSRGANIQWNSLTSSVEYNTNNGTYDSRTSLLGYILTICDTAYNRYVSRIGGSPDLPGQHITIDMTDVNRIARSMRLSNPQIELGAGETSMQTAIGDYNGEFFTSEQAQYFSNGEWHYGWSGFFRLYGSCNETHDSSRQQDQPPHSEDVKIGVLTRTKWNWKTLKRGSD